MRSWRLTFLFVLSLFIGAATRVGAQTVDVIRGRVTGPDSLAIQGVRVVVTSLSGAVNREARTDRNGRFTVTFPNGEGDYFVTYTYLGYAPRRFEIKRAADEDILIADARMSKTTELDAMRISAPRDRVNRVEANADISGTEKTASVSALSAADMGNLAAMAASLPGVTLIPGADGDPSGFSVLGLSADQNSTTLNGQNSSASDLPRDAALSVALNTGTYDVSRGGFSGGQLSVRTRSGTNFKIRTMSLNLDAPQLQWTDAAGRALGQQYTNISLGGLASGAFTLDKSFYSVSYQLGRKSNPLSTLLNMDPLALQTTGVSADSVTRLLGIMALAMPPAALIPVHTIVMLGAGITRTMIMWRHVMRHTVIPFVIGAAIGAAAGAKMFVSLSPSYLQLILGVFMLLVTWMPSLGRVGAERGRFAFLGFGTTFLGVFVSATGTLLAM